ncbi:MAG: hypothetical protein Q7J75_01190, partial [Rhodoferax sp.]|nr:hypothetical protein [Rhodoferax sp.]
TSGQAHQSRVSPSLSPWSVCIPPSYGERTQRSDGNFINPRSNTYDGITPINFHGWLGILQNDGWGAGLAGQVGEPGLPAGVSDFRSDGTGRGCEMKQ